MKEIKNEVEIKEVYDPSKMIKIFENQKISLNKDIIFLKEDILKDFKRIENSLNTKYEKQNANTVNKLYKFETTIEAMKTKVNDLSSLITTDKNIQQKVLQLTEFKRATTDKMINQEITMKMNSAQLKEAINKYDKLLSDSIIYPAIIGNNAQFKDFHELIDYILLGINQFNIFRDQNTIDFKDYAIKIENLYKTLKAQADSIVNSCSTYCAKQIGQYDTKIGKRINDQESRIFEYQKENDEMLSKIEEKMNNINAFMNIIDKRQEELYKKLEEQMNTLKEYKDEINKNFEIYNNNFELINNRLKHLNKKIKKEKLRNKEILIPNKESNSTNNQNSGVNLKKSQLGKSIVKKYIAGEISYNEIERSQTKKKVSKKSNEKKLEKRMAFGPDKLGDDVFDNNLLKKNSDLVNINSFKSSNRNSQKEESEFTDSSIDKNEEDIKNKNIQDSRNQNQNLLKIPSILNDEEYKSSDMYSTKQKAYQLLMFQNQKDYSLNKNNNRYKDFGENKNNFFENNNINEEKNSILTKLKSIGDNNNVFYNDNKKRNKRKINKSNELYEKINNINNHAKYNYYSIFNDYNDIKIKNTQNKLNVIEVNFDKNYQDNKEKDDLQDLIKKIKENRHFSSVRKNNFQRKNKVIKLGKSEATSCNFDLLNKNKNIKEEANNYKSFNNINNFHTTKNSFNKPRLYSSKND